jgi:2-iminobutanoate/2-iminopropanoate deaminase
MKAIFTKSAPNPVGPYSQAIQVGEMLFCSGQIALDPQTGEFEGGDIGQQTESVIQNLKAVLEAAGATLQNVVKTTCFLANIEDLGVFNEIYGKYFTSKPARSCLAAKELPKNALLEMEAIAHV